MRTFVIGDIHGNELGLKQALERSKFDYENDTLITLGDICDGYSHVYECVEELLKIKNRIDIRGNHDEPFIDFINAGIHSWSWQQGGFATLKSYGESCLGPEDSSTQFMATWNGSHVVHNLNNGDIPQSHKDFFNHQILYYVDDKNRCFVHGGFNRHAKIKTQKNYTLYWDRDLWMAALSYKNMPVGTHGITNKPYSFKMKDNFSEVFIGHTSTINWKTTEPMQAANIWNLDTGGGFGGKITIMDVDTHEYWQSDLAEELYPDEIGRRRKKEAP